jgi:alpha-glucosidase (family GH31 glycosyl hydrolase)
MRKILLLLIVVIPFGFFNSCKKECTVTHNPNDTLSSTDTVYVQNTPWPKWVFQHWVWEGEGTTASARQLADDYLAHGIPVGAIIIDSPWETDYNTGEWDSTLYPDAQGMVNYFHSKNIRVLCWITGLIDTNVHPLYDYGRDHDYFMKENASAGPGIVKWWKPVRCSLIDFYNPDAVAWWKSLMDKTLNTGIDGWKCDGSDFLLYDLQSFKQYFYSPYLHANIPNRNDYSDKYYRTIQDYSRAKLGSDRIVMSRPIDNYGYPFSGATVAFTPTDMGYALWVGDQDATFAGMKAALNNMYQSDAYGYLSSGSDIGGYRTDNSYPTTGRSKELFIRWAQLGTFCGLMENGGGGEHRPWLFDQETEDIYRKLVIMREKYLVGYLLKSSKEARDQNRTMMKFSSSSKYTYMLGDDIFVAPVLDPSGSVTITFPAGSDKWVYLYDKTQVFDGGTSTTKTFTLEEFPVYIKHGTATADVLKP